MDAVSEKTVCTVMIQKTLYPAIKTEQLNHRIVSEYLNAIQSQSTERSLLGDSGGVVNSLDFCPASLKSLGCFYFRCVLSSQWKAVTVNLRILHCQR